MAMWLYSELAVRKDSSRLVKLHLCSMQAVMLVASPLVQKVYGARCQVVDAWCMEMAPRSVGAARKGAARPILTLGSDRKVLAQRQDFCTCLQHLSITSALLLKRLEYMLLRLVQIVQPYRLPTDEKYLSICPTENDACSFHMTKALNPLHLLF